MGRFRNFLTGGILGLIAGVLVAPKKGEETRAKIKEETSKLSNAVKDTIEKVDSVSKDIIDKTKNFFNKN